ncbi:MAG: metallophosphoesterase [Pirellulales bacterium]
MKKPIQIYFVLVMISACLWSATTAWGQQERDALRFTSVPDIFNWNISNPQPGWEDALDWFFDRLQDEGPDFTLVAGDIMDARWWDDAEQVRRKTEQYWGGYNKRFKDRDMTVYIAPGDHEYGDDGGLARGDIARAFGEEFSRQMGMPRNGPAGHVGRSFFVRYDNLLLITLDTFEDAGKRFAYTVGNEQLEWMEKVLTEHKDAPFVIVQGHLPIVGPVKSKNSSASMLKGGTNSGLWKLMVKHKVDAYLCGEHHRITVKKHDGIWQIVHGALWGTQTDLNYMRGSVTDGELTLEMIEFDVAYSGDYIGDHPHRGATNRPRESVRLADNTKENGPRITGTLVLQAVGESENKVTKATGWFEKDLSDR